MSQPFLFSPRPQFHPPLRYNSLAGNVLSFSFFDLLDFQHELWIRLFMMNQQARPARC